MRFAMLAAFGAAIAAHPAAAFEPLEGYYIALKTCEAFLSKNKLTNPGGVTTEPFRAYAMIALNRAAGDFYQMRVPGAPVTTDRWVHVSCGVHVVEAGTPVADDAPGEVDPQPGAESTDNLLALSWQPAFCETRPEKAECRSLNAGDLPASERQLSIHGLWPQPRDQAYCGVPAALVRLDEAGMWAELPEPALDAETRELLAVAMPGTMSFLERHEWIKHGTCHRGAGGADEYYDDTLLVTEAVNASAVGDLLASHVGAEVETAEIRAHFDAAFGPGAGERVKAHCAGDQGRTLIQELRVALKGAIEPAADLGALIRAAEPVPAGCPRGVMDPAGLQ